MTKPATILDGMMEAGPCYLCGSRMMAANHAAAWTTADSGGRICAICSGDLERDALLSGDRQLGYVNSMGDRVISFMGGQLGQVVASREWQGGCAGQQRWVRMVDVWGQVWSGRGPVENGTYVRLRKVGGE